MYKRIILKLILKKIVCELDSSGPGLVTLAASCERSGISNKTGIIIIIIIF